MKYKFVYDWDTTDLLGCQSLNSNGITREDFVTALEQNPDLHRYSRYYSPIPNNSMIQYSELLPQQQYVYCIQVASHKHCFIPKFADRLQIPQHVRSDVLSGRAFVLIQYVFEGMIYLDSYSQFCDVVSRLQLPKDRVVLLHGDFNTEKFQNSPFTYEPFNIFPNWIIPSSSLIDYLPKKLYVTYNRNPRTHRMILIANLIKNNLIDDGIVSLGAYRYNTANLSRIDASLTPTDCKRLIEYISHSPDGVNLEVENPANTINIEHHRHSFVSLVSETQVEDNVSFFSEKIYKPISIGHPFVLLSNPYSLKRLHELGYKTFSKYWDEDYDGDTNWVTRIHKIMRILEQLQKLSDAEKINMRQDMIPILEHNRRLFIEHNKQTTAFSTLNNLFDRYLT